MDETLSLCGPRAIRLVMATREGSEIAAENC
jgi:hypothetical protein